MKNAFAHNAFAASGGISQTAADARYVLKASGSFTGLTGAGFRDTSAAFDVTQTFTSSTVLDAARSITWDVKNASHSLKFTAASIVTFPAGTNTLLGSAVANSLSATLTITSAYIDSVNGLGFRNRNAANDTNTSTLDGASGLQMSQNHMVGWGTGWSAGSDRLALGPQSGVSNTLVFGGWQGSATPFASRLSGNFGAGTNITGGTLNLGTQGTGTGTGGIINFQSHAAGASGSTLGTLVTVASTLSDRFKVASGMLLQIGNAAATEALVCDKSIQFLDSTGTAYKVPCVAA